MFDKLKLAWEVWRAYREAIGDRSNMTFGERAAVIRPIVAKLLSRNDIEWDDEFFVVLCSAIPHIDPFWAAWSDGNAQAVTDSVLAILRDLAKETASEADDKVAVFMEASVARTVLAAVIELVMNLVASEKDTDGYAAGEHGSPALIIGAVSLVLQIIKFIRDRK